MSTTNKTASEQAFSRRAFLQFAGVGVGATVLAACSAVPAAEQGASTGEAGAATGEQTSISFWTPGGSQIFCDGFDTIAANYEAEHPEIDVEDVQCGTGEQSFNEVLLARIAAGNPPDATIMWSSPAAFGARNALLELDELMSTSQYSQKDSWPENVLASCIFNGSTYGLPVAAGTYAMFYNEDLFKEKGLPHTPADFPKTWDELRELSKEFTTWNGDALETAGFIPAHETVPVAIWSALNGGMLYDGDNQQYLLDSENNVEFFDYMMSWLDEEYMGDITKVNVSANWDSNPDKEGRPSKFLGGQHGMLTEGFWYCADMYNYDVQVENWNVAPFPVGPSGTETTSGYWPNWLVIPRGSANPEAAFDYLDYMAVEGIEIWFQNIPDLPTNKNVPTDLYSLLTAEKRGEEFTQEITDFFRGQLDIATPMWNSPIQDFANDQVERAVERIQTKTATPQEALAEAQQACQTELDNLLQEIA